MSNKYQDYYKNHLVEMVHAGVSLEGPIATRVQTKEVIVHGESSSVPFKTNRIIKNILNGWNFIMSGKYSSPLDEMFLRNLHYGLSEGVIDYLKEECYRGKFRDFSVYIGGCSYVPPVYSNENASRRLRLLFSVYDGSVDSILTIYCYLMKYQFFANTNKRTAFLWVNACLYKSDSEYLLKLPTSESARRTFIKKLLAFYESDSQIESLKSYLKRYYLVEV